MSELQLKNYPSGDEEFDRWYRETQPDDAKRIDERIENESRFINKLVDIKTSILDIHKAIRGEARQDPNLYCSVCVDKNGSHVKYPCKTVRAISKL